jgi:radical SAM superfamily enzyme YgiQ (UPF0313 family)
MHYYGTVIRPPSEAESYILQVTYGCSNNHCTFCGTYLDKPFQTRKVDDFLEDIRLSTQVIPGARRVFLADGDALVLNTRRLITILDELRKAFPSLERVGSYATAQNILNKSDADLTTLRDKGLKILYLGLESGSDDVLANVNKGVTAGEMIQAVHKAKSAGMLVSIIGILGLGGPELSDQHAEETGRVVSQMNPNYFSMLTLMLVPGTRLHQDWSEGKFILLQPEEMLSELRQVLANVEGLTNCVFRTNHASNYLPLRGTLDADKVRLLENLDTALKRGKDALRPESWRGL